MKILWISSLAWKENGKYKYEINGSGAVSGSLFQQSMIEGLEKLGHKVDIISDYPYAKGKLWHPAFIWQHRPQSLDFAIPSIHIPYLSILFKSRNIKKAVKYNVKNNNYDIVIAYLIHQPFMRGLYVSKKYLAKVKTVLICPDLPDMMDLSLKEKKIKSALKKFDNKRIQHLYTIIDGFVFFSENMKERIDTRNKSYIVIEGIATIADLDISSVKKGKDLVYAGTLHKNIGIEQIIESLKYINDSDVNVVFFGTGELENYIREIAKTNPRVKYGGFIERDKLFEYQKKALALINVRNPNDNYTKYSFPSKTFEYLYSGTPFISTKLEGIPNEYNKYMFLIEENSPLRIAKMIDYISENYDNCLQKSLDAREFVKSEKNYIKQAERLNIFIQQIRGQHE